MLKIILQFFIFSSCLFATQNVSLQLKWRNSFQFAGFYMAKEKGFYKKFGLNVTIKELKAGKRIDVVKEVLDGVSTYGVSDSKLVYEILKNRPVELLMPIMDHSPLVLVSLNKDVKRLEDIRDKNVTINRYTVKNPSIISMFKSRGIDVNNLNIKTLKYTYENFIKHKAVFSIYETDELYYLEKLDADYRLFKPQDYGFDFYGDILFTSKNELKLHSKRVKDFITASRDGWRYAMSHIDETIDVILKKYDTQHLKYSKLKDEAMRMLPYVSKNFSFDSSRLRSISDVYVLLGIAYAKQDIRSCVYMPGCLNKDEKMFFQSHILKCLTISNWEPFTIMTNGKLDGIAVDYMNEIKSKLHLKSTCKIAKVWSDVLKHIKEKKADFTISTDITPDREKYAVFSKPYATYPIVIAANRNVDFIPNMSFLSDKKIAVAKNYTAEKILKKHYPNLTLIETKNTNEALRLVKNGKAYAAIDILPVLAYMINKNYPSSLKIVGKTPFSFSVRMMVRKDYANIIPAVNRAIDCISSKKKKEIYNRWISVTYQKGYTLRQIVIFILLGVIVLTLIFLWVFLLKREIKTRKKLEKELEKLATTDKLTSIYNRHKIDLSLQEQIEISKRYERPFGVIFFDIDYFKNINDTYGHKIGDMVLIELTNLVSKTIRKSDLFGRWGGEEFLIISPEITKEESIKLAEKLKKAIQNHNFQGVEKLTCSFGVTNYRQEDSVDTIMKRVDKKLYRAKNKGRNRVEFD